MGFFSVEGQGRIRVILGALLFNKKKKQLNLGLYLLPKIKPKSSNNKILYFQLKLPSNCVLIYNLLQVLSEEDLSEILTPTEECN